jgi:hypothetical protein
MAGNGCFWMAGLRSFWVAVLMETGGTVMDFKRRRHHNSMQRATYPRRGKDRESSASRRFYFPVL